VETTHIDTQSCGNAAVPQVPEATCSVRLSERDEAEVMASAEKPPSPNEAAVQAAKRFLQRHG
jgi:uncharacterized protein (DUF1778 family)